MKIKAIKFKQAIVRPDTAAGATELVRAGDAGCVISYDEKRDIFILTGQNEVVEVPWSNVAYVKGELTKPR